MRLKNLLLIVLLLLVVRDVEEPVVLAVVIQQYILDLKARLGSGHDTQPVTQLSALQELLREVLEVALREGDGGLHPDLALALTGDLHDVTELTGLTVNLDAVVQELLEGITVQHTVASGAREVDEEVVALGSSTLRGTSANHLVVLNDSHNESE